jgi:hypothetical protein
MKSQSGLQGKPKVDKASTFAHLSRKGSEKGQSEASRHASEKRGNSSKTSETDKEKEKKLAADVVVETSKAKRSVQD